MSVPIKSSQSDILNQDNSLTNLTNFNLRPISGEFKILSGRAIEWATRKRIHPHDRLGSCFTVQAAEFSDGRSAILINASPSPDVLSNWNKSKYKKPQIQGFSIDTDKKAELLEQIQVVSGYSFEPDEIIVVDKIAPFASSFLEYEEASSSETQENIVGALPSPIIGPD